MAGSLLPSLEEDTASPLTSRIISWEIFPLSFREFLDGKGIDNDFSSSPTRISVNPRKVYFVDHALAASVSSGILSNRDSLLENLMFTALRQVTPEIFYHKTKRAGRWTLSRCYQCPVMNEPLC